MPEARWPRRWYNFPIIMCGVVLQFSWVVALICDKASVNVTAIRVLLPYVHPVYAREMLIGILSVTASLAFAGFFIKRKLYALMALVPQQFLLFLSAGGALHQIILGQFADGTVRTPAFLFADQSAVIAFAIFHSWALVLILLHGEG